jgi:HK97 family phage prohead protease
MKKDSNKETRVLNLDVSNLKVEERDGGIKTINGYAALFNKDSEDMGFIERIHPDAFKKSDLSDVRGLFNHDANLIFARSGVNLTLKPDKKGLFMEATPISTSTYQMVAENIAAGLVTQQSFAFTVAEDEWSDDFKIRTLRKIDKVFDVSAVTYAAYPDTDVALRSLEKAKKGQETPLSNEPPETPTSEDTPLRHKSLQTAEELEARYQQILERIK